MIVATISKFQKDAEAYFDQVVDDQAALVIRKQLAASVDLHRAGDVKAHDLIKD